MSATSNIDLNAEPKKNSGARLFNPWLIVPLLMLAFILVAPFLYRSSVLSSVADIGDPFDVAAFCDINVFEEQNAFKEYREAARLLTRQPPSNFDEQTVEGESLWKVAPPEIQKWVVENQNALAVWRKGTEKPDALYIPPSQFTLLTPLPDVQSLREISRLARLEGSRLEDAGELEAAWQIHHALFRCSRHVGRHGCPIERLVGVALHNWAVESTTKWAENPKVTEAMLQTALADVRSSYGLSESFATAIKVEYVAHLNFLALAISQNNLAWQMQNMGSATGSGNLTPVEMFLKSEPELGRRIMQHWCADLLEQHSTAAEKATLPEHLSQQQLAPIIKNSPVASALIPTLDQAASALKTEQARQAALEMTLAAQIHYRKHGRFPENANELVQNGLPGIPADPWATNPGPMNYRLDAKTGTIIVWSVGQNAVDDRGAVKTVASVPLRDIGIESHAPAAVPKN